MKIIQVISEGKNGESREVIGEDNGQKKTFHLKRSSGVWCYCNGSYQDKDGERHLTFTQIGSST